MSTAPPRPYQPARQVHREGSSTRVRRTKRVSGTVTCPGEVPAGAPGAQGPAGRRGRRAIPAPPTRRTSTTRRRAMRASSACTRPRTTRPASAAPRRQTTSATPTAARSSRTSARCPTTRSSSSRFRAASSGRSTSSARASRQAARSSRISACATSSGEALDLFVRPNNGASFHDVVQPAFTALFGSGLVSHLARSLRERRHTERHDRRLRDRDRLPLHHPGDDHQEHLMKRSRATEPERSSPSIGVVFRRATATNV